MGSVGEDWAGGSMGVRLLISIIVLILLLALVSVSWAWVDLDKDSDGDGLRDHVDDYDDDNDGILDIHDEDDDGDGIRDLEDPDWFSHDEVWHLGHWDTAAASLYLSSYII